MYCFLVTCGRGFEYFVTEEIFSTLPNASNVEIISEGKIRFSISVGKNCNGLESPAVNLDFFKGKFSKLFQLKLIERIFLLLHYKKFDALSIRSDLILGEDLISEICASVNWKEITEQVKLLLKLQPKFKPTSCCCKHCETPLKSFVKDLHCDCPITDHQTKAKSTNLLPNNGSILSIKSNILSPSTDSIKKHIATADVEEPSAELIPSCSSKDKKSLRITENAGNGESNINNFIEFRVSCRLTGRWKKLVHFRSCRNDIDEKKCHAISFKKQQHLPVQQFTDETNLLVLNYAEYDARITCHKSDDSKRAVDLSHGCNAAGKINVQFIPYTNMDHSSCCFKRKRTYNDPDIEHSHETDSEKDQLECPGISSRNIHTCSDLQLQSSEISCRLSSSFPKNFPLQYPPDGTSDHDAPPGEKILSSGKNTFESSSSTMDASSNATIDKKNIQGVVLSAVIKSVLQQTDCWHLNWNQPNVDVYFNITDLHVILGIALSRHTVSLRCYIPHIGLRTTVCCLMLRLALVMPTSERHSSSQSCTSSQNPCSTALMDNQDEKKTPEAKSPTEALDCYSLLDPMCGHGTILAEAAHSYRVRHVIGCDVSRSQLEVATCNLHGIPPASSYSLFTADAAALPLLDGSIDAIVCDFPFGQQHRPHLTRKRQDSPRSPGYTIKGGSGSCITSGANDHRSFATHAMDEAVQLLELFLLECARVLVVGGPLVVLLPARMEGDVVRLCTRLFPSDGRHMTLMARHRIALGTSNGIICALKSCLQAASS